MRTKGCSYKRIFAVDQSVGVVSRAVITKGGDESEIWYIAGSRLTRYITDRIRSRLSQALDILVPCNARAVSLFLGVT